MADGLELNAGSGGATLATDDAGAAGHVQVVKLALSADGSATAITADSNGLEVQGAGVAGTPAGGVVSMQGVASGTAMPVSIATVPSHAVTNAGTFAVQVDAAIPAGDNNIGNVDLASAIPAGTNNIGDIDVLTVPADPFGANADAASATGSISAKLRFIAGTGIPVTGTVTVGSHAVTNAGTFAVQDSQKIADDAAFVVATTPVQPVGFLADETSPDAVDEGDIGAARMTLERKVRVVAALDSAAMQSGNDEVIPKFAVIDHATSGDNTLVAGVTDKKLRVLSLYLIAAGTVTVRFESAASGTAKSGQLSLIANVGFVLPFNPVGWFETIAGELLNLELSGAVSVDGGLTYIEVD